MRHVAAVAGPDTRRIYNFADKPERLAMSLPAFLDFAGGLSHHLHMQYVGLAPVTAEPAVTRSKSASATFRDFADAPLRVHFFPLWARNHLMLKSR